MTTGWFVADMPEDKYHGMSDRLSSTGIKALLACPARFQAERLAGGRPPKDAFDLGSAAHTLVLGTGWELAVWSGTWQGKEAQEFKTQAYADRKIPVKTEQFEQVTAMAQRLKDHPVAGRWFDPAAGVSEISLFWTDEETLVDCRARLDRVTLTDDERPLIVDYKTTSDASPHGIRNHVAKYGYYIQQAFYQEGMVESGLDPDGIGDFRFVFQETAYPYPVTVVRLAATASWLGRQDVARAKDLYARCTDLDEWPEYATGEIEIDLPKWKYYTD